MSTFLDGAKWVFGGFTSRLSTQNLTANRNIDLPNRSGTLAMIDQIGSLGVQNSNLVTISESVTGSSAVFRIFGSAPFGNDQNNGVVFRLIANLSNNRQLLFHASDDNASSGSGLRMQFAGAFAGLDSVSPDGLTRSDIVFGSDTRSVGVGGFAPASTVVFDVSGQNGKDIAQFRAGSRAVVWMLSNAGVQTLSNAEESVSTATGALRIPGIGLGNGAISVSRRIGFTATTAASHPNGSLFLDSASGKLSFKDVAGTVNTLY